MTLALKKCNHILPFLILLILGSGLLYLAQHPITQLYPKQMSWGIGLDFILTLPIFYLLLIWNRPIPKISVVPVVFLGSFIAHTFLPLERIPFFVYFRALCIPLLELAVIGFIGHKVYKLYKKYPRGQHGDVFSALKSSCREIIPGMAGRFLATELATLYYGFFASKPSQVQKDEFSYHKESGVFSVLGVFIFLIFIETIALHLLLQLWSSTAALLLTLLSLYTALQFWGILRSLPRRPIRLDQERQELELYFGILSEATIPLPTITHWKAKPGLIPQSEDFQELSPLGSLGGSYNFLIRVEKEGEIQGLYGKKTLFHQLAFFVDDPDGLSAALDKAKKRVE